MAEQEEDQSSSTEIITSFSNPQWKWNNGEPPTWSINPTTGCLTISPSAGLDYWSRTYYGPDLLVKSNAPSLVANIPQHKEATLSTAFTLHPRAQFDQAGIMVLVDDNNKDDNESGGSWVKAGIEYTDGHPCLSCVVTNDGYSDWSTQRLPFNSSNEMDGEGKKVSIRIRVTKHLPGIEQGPCITMEACEYKEGDTVDSPGDWYQVRIASLRGGSNWRMGVFSISPIVQNGSKVEFHHVKLGSKVLPVHDAGITSVSQRDAQPH